jgi:WS/DGAT/MGAT family acyltransferase
VHADQFDLDDHLLRAALPAPAGQHELEALAGDLASTPVSTGRPMWAFHLVEAYQGGSAIIVRIHHSYADGMALMRVLARLADPARRPAGELAVTESLEPPARWAPAEFASALIPELLTQSVRKGAELIEKGVHYAMHPGEAGAATRDMIGLAGEVARIGVLLADDPLTRLKRPLTGVKRAAWAAPVALEEVRTLAHVLGCTINDVLVATLAGALGRYLDAHGDHTAGLTIRATVPVNLRSDSDAQMELGNRFGLVFVELPVGIRHPLERLFAVHRSMQALKASSEALATYGLLMLVGTLPASVENPAVAFFSAKASVVASNLRGPLQAISLGGSVVSQLLFWVPQSGSIGTGLSILTYAGAVQFGVIADRNQIPELGELMALINTEFDRLVYLVLMGGAALLD